MGLRKSARRSLLLSVFNFLSLGPFVAACSSGSSTSAGAGGGGDGGAATFTEVYAQVIGTTCTSCHAPGGPGVTMGKLDMSTQAAAYANLVGTSAAGTACGASGEERVVAGHSAMSLLYQKVSMSSPPCGGRMPLGGTPLTDVQQALIASWIDEGARND